MRSLAFCAGALCVLSFFGCKELDPVDTQDLCHGPGPISMRCPQCAKPKYDDRCSICLHKDVDPELCEGDTGMRMNPSTDAGRGGNPAPSGGAGDSPEAGEGGAGAAGVGGGEGQAGESGSGGMTPPAAAGQGGAPAMVSDVCTGELWCAMADPQRPHCDLPNKRCVECTDDAHCPNGVCNLTLQRCQMCRTDADCKTNACDEASNVCVDCNRDADCQVGDPMREYGSCDVDTFSCVDCVENIGCPDKVRGTCDKGALKCVDCITDLDCNEPGKPACEDQMRICVPCLLDDHCEDPVLATCDKPNRRCVDCIDDNGCRGGANAHCDTTAQKCVQCTDASHCQSGHCVKQRCVECEDDGDCWNTNKARCELSTNVCVACNSDANCMHLPETPVCDRGSGACVECNNDSTCGDKACIRAQHTCSDVVRGSVDVCLECAADSMCRNGMRCVPLTFGSQSVGSSCVYTRSSRTNRSCNSAQPYSRVFSSRSVDDPTATDFCVPPATTTCQGVLDVSLGASGSGCTVDSDCGVPGVDDGHCVDASRCTYVCGAEGADVNCPIGLHCLTSGMCG